MLNVNSDINPYARFIEGHSAETLLNATPASLERLVAKLGPDGVSRSPAPGKWSSAEIVAHLADCEIAFGFRLRQTLAEENHTVQPFDQDRWAATYSGISTLASEQASSFAQQALAAFIALRRWNLLLIGAALPTAADKKVMHPERGAMTFKTIVETMAGHDVNHLKQLEAIAGA